MPPSVAADAAADAAATVRRRGCSVLPRQAGELQREAAQMHDRSLQSRMQAELRDLLHLALDLGARSTPPRTGA